MPRDPKCKVSPIDVSQVDRFHLPNAKHQPALVDMETSSIVDSNGNPCHYRMDFFDLLDEMKKKNSISFKMKIPNNGKTYWQVELN